MGPSSMFFVCIAFATGPAAAFQVGPSIVTPDGSFSGVASFGSRTAISGDTALIGCRYGRSAGGSSVAQFRDRTATGWTFVQQFSGVSRYSISVDISGDHAVVGAPYISGEKMYVYERVAGVWSEVQVVDGWLDGHDWFGEAVAVDGDWAAVTAPDSLHINGPIYLRKRTPTGWNPAGVLSYSNGWGAGESLDMSLPLLVAGDPEWEDKGAVQVFQVAVAGGNGSFDALLTAPDGEDYDEFGRSVAIQGNRAVVGAPYHWTGGLPNAGAAYVFERAAGIWQFRVKLVGSPLTASEQLGTSVALDGDRILVGGRGVACLFEQLAGTWSLTERLTSPITSTHFGSGVAIDGAHALVGARDVATVFAYELTQGPEVYCTAKFNSAGCRPEIGYSGDPSATLAQPFSITAVNVINNKSGTLFYGTSGRLAVPFQGGVQCVAAPRRRTGLQSSGGNVGFDDCSGTYAYDLNARIQSGVDPALAAGVTVDAQYWMRDGQASYQTGLSDALELVIAP